MGSGNRPIGNTVAVDVEIAAEVLAGIEIFGAHHFAAIVATAIVPVERLTEVIVHSDVEVGHDEHRGLQSFGQIESLRAESEALVGIFGEQQHVLGIAVRSVGAGQQVGLLGARRHSGRRSAALDVEDHRRHFGKIRQPEELLHQRDAGAGSRGEGACAVPRGADDHADRRQLVFSLDDGVTRHAVIGVGAVLAAIAAERLDDRRRRGDRVPRGNRRAAINGAEAAGVVAVDEDALADAVRTLDAQADRAG